LDESERRQTVLDLAAVWGVKVADTPVCPGHSAPLDYLTEWLCERPAISLVHGPRGGGKSYLAALATHIESQGYPWHGTKILGGSLAQSQQIYNAIREFDRLRPGDLSSFMKERAVYARTGSEVSILAASPSSVRGPHVPTLRLDEVDEIDDEIRDAAAGMCMQTGAERASVSMTSTWHKVGGPMQRLKDAAADPESGIRSHTFCMFEVLERCPDERSGPNLERCPQCPIVKWCHDGTPVPKAKRSNGHYAIDALIQKTALVSPRAFESDYLSMGPRAAGLWFTSFDPALHVRESAEFNPRLPVIVAVDSGVFTGAVFLQVTEAPRHLNVFGDYLSEGLSAEVNALAIVAMLDKLCGGRRDRVLTDPAGGSRTAVGPTVEGEYLNAGLKDRNGRLEFWPNYGGSVRASLDLIDALFLSADGTVSLTIHPRCRALVTALQNYRRAKRGGQWQDYPEDPQHPHEDLCDALRGAALALFPEGRKPQPVFRNAHASRFV
jgi:hypothetical protein